MKKAHNKTPRLIWLAMSLLAVILLGACQEGQTQPAAEATDVPQVAEQAEATSAPARPMMGPGSGMMARHHATIPAEYNGLEAKRVIYLFMAGAPSQLDTWDMKPEAPAEIRGPFQPIDTASGVIEEGTIALNHYRHIGRTRAGTEIIQEQIWYLDDIEQTRLQSKMDIPRESGWRIAFEGV